MGDSRFLLGNVNDHDYKAIFHGKTIKEICKRTIIECLPNCNTCVYKCYCGSDPIRNYLETKDIIHNRSNYFFCFKNKYIFDFLFKMIRENDPEIMNVFWGWINNRAIQRN